MLTVRNFYFIRSVKQDFKLKATIEAVLEQKFKRVL